MATSKYKKTTQGSSVIPNNYAGKSAAKIWNDWSKEQRKHFISDHMTKFLHENDIEAFWKHYEGTFEKLPLRAQEEVEKHVMEGQYATGGEIISHNNEFYKKGGAIKPKEVYKVKAENDNKFAYAVFLYEGNYMVALTRDDWPNQYIDKHFTQESEAKAEADRLAKRLESDEYVNKIGKGEKVRIHKEGKYENMTGEIAKFNEDNTYVVKIDNGKGGHNYANFKRHELAEIKKHESGGLIDKKDSLLHYIQYFNRSGYVGSRLYDLGYLNGLQYAVIDKVKPAMIQLLMDEGDEQYSIVNLNRLIKRAALKALGEPSTEAKIPFGVEFAKGGQIGQSQASAKLRGKYVWLQNQNGVSTPLSQESFEESFLELQNDKNWELIREEADLKLFKRKADGYLLSYSLKEIYAEGGAIPNAYEGKTDEQIWDEWTPAQRAHFLSDHRHEFSSANFGNERQASTYLKIGQHFSYNELPSIVRIALREHIVEGSYKGGGEIKKQGVYMPEVMEIAERSESFGTYTYGKTFEKWEKDFLQNTHTKYSKHNLLAAFELMQKIEKKAVEFYLDYVNNYTSVKAIAEHYNVSEKVATVLIESGRKINENVSSFYNKGGKVIDHNFVKWQKIGDIVRSIKYAYSQNLKFNVRKYGSDGTYIVGVKFSSYPETYVQKIFPSYDEAVTDAEFRASGQYSKGGTVNSKKFGEVMHEFKNGLLKDQWGNVVKSRGQALAIAYAESGAAGERMEDGGEVNESNFPYWLYITKDNMEILVDKFFTRKAAETFKDKIDTKFKPRIVDLNKSSSKINKNTFAPIFKKNYLETGKIGWDDKNGAEPVSEENRILDVYIGSKTYPDEVLEKYRIKSFKTKEKEKADKKEKEFRDDGFTVKRREHRGEIDLMGVKEYKSEDDYYEHGGETEEVAEIKVRDFPYYLRKIDSTHLSVSIEKGKKGTPYHVGQYKGEDETFYNDAVKWLHGDLDINGKSYKTFYAKGGHLGFEGLQEKVAKEYEGKPVPAKYRNKYGKTYSHKEAMEVGAKTPAKVNIEIAGNKYKTKK